MGLLTKVNDKKRSLTVKNIYSEKMNIDNKKKNQINDFLEKAKNLDQGFEYSNKLLQLLSNFMGFKKSALLILEEYHKLFIPASHIDIDITTVRHLRIPYTVFSDQFNSYYQNLNKSDKKVKIFKQYFSIREFSALNSFVLVPFYSKNHIKSVLVIVDPTEDTLMLCKDVSLNSEKYILKLYKSRKPFTDILDIEQEDKSSNPGLLLQGLINTIKNNNSLSLLIITLNFKSLKNAIIDYLPNVESYEISNDIIKAISKLVKPNGEIQKINSVKCLLFYKIKRGKSPDIIVHQLNVAISTFFNLPASLPSINTSVKEFHPEEITNADTILAGLL